MQSQHLLVPFAKSIPTSILTKPTPTSTYCKAIIYQYLMVQDDAFSIVRGANFNIVGGAVFSIVQGAVFNIVQDDAFSIVQGDAFVEILHKLLGPRWRCSANQSGVLGEA